jgi:Family of unknown function (DUF6152)
MKPTRVIALSAFLVLAGGAYPVAAHHATTMFDHATTITMTGTVTEVHWTNPHVAIYVNGYFKEGEAPAVWLLEMTSPGNLVRSEGWTRTAVKPGDKVTVDLSPLRDGKKGGALKKITILETGKVYSTNIRQQERANLEQETPAK